MKNLHQSFRSHSGAVHTICHFPWSVTNQKVIPPSLQGLQMAYGAACLNDKVCRRYEIT